MFKKMTLIIWVFVIAGLAAGVVLAQKTTNQAPASQETTAGTLAPANMDNRICPVTGNTIAASEVGKNTVEYEGKIYNLCSPSCKDVFLQNPSVYVAKVQEELAARRIMEDEELRQQREREKMRAEQERIEIETALQAKSAAGNQTSTQKKK